MKANKLILCALASLFTIQLKSPNPINKDSHHVIQRIPASENEIAPQDNHCKSESKGEQLESDVNKLLEDKVEILKVVEAPKENIKTDSSELLALMSQMTTLFTSQMQMQIQMQNQMMNMILQMQSNIMPQLNPYSPNLYSNNFNYQLSPTLNDNLSVMGSGIGLPLNSQPSIWSQYSNPYSSMPLMERQQIIAPIKYGFDFSQTTVAL
jgi:hypothetical protein